MAGTDGYADYLEVLGPTVNRGPNAVQKQRAYGDLQDEHTRRVVEAVEARFPETAVTNGAADALQYHELERQLDRGVGEASAAFATRLREAWDRWPFAGSARSVLKAFKDQGYSHLDVSIVQANGVHWNIAADPSDVTTPTYIPGPWSFWITDGDTSFWSKFVVLFKDMPPGPNWFTSTTLVYAAETSKTFTFPTAFPDTTYRVLIGIESTSSTPLARITSKTTNGLTVVTDASFTGSIHVLCYQGNDFPLFSVTPSEQQKMCRIVKRWKAGKATFVEFVGIVRGHYWGELGLNWGAASLVWGPASPNEPITIKREC